MVKRTIALQVLTGVGAAALSFALAGTAAADESSTSSTPIIRRHRTRSGRR